MSATNDLVPMKMYFLLAFLDDRTSIPHIKTLFYVGKNIRAHRGAHKHDMWYFQDAEDYIKLRKKRPHVAGKIGGRLFRVPGDCLNLIHDLDGLISRLQKLKSEVQISREGRT